MMKLITIILLFFIGNNVHSQEAQDSVIRFHKLPVSKGFLRLLDLSKMRGDPSPFLKIYSVTDSVFNLENSIVSNIVKMEEGTMVLTRKKNGEFNIYANLAHTALVPGQHINRGDLVGQALKEEEHYLLLFAIMAPLKIIEYLPSLDYLRKNHE